MLRAGPGAVQTEQTANTFFITFAICFVHWEDTEWFFETGERSTQCDGNILCFCSNPRTQVQYAETI